MNAVTITIEEWAGDNGIQVNEEQVKELSRALEFCSEMDGNRHLGGEFEEQKTIKTLKNKIELLERFISLKGYSIETKNNTIKEHIMVRISDTHVASDSILHQF